MDKINLGLTIPSYPMAVSQAGSRSSHREDVFGKWAFLLSIALPAYFYSIEKMAKDISMLIFFKERHQIVFEQPYLSLGRRVKLKP